ncbi:hypothetical protein B9J78_01135 [bacterium Unc6]|nr:hypothetical protein [bacterium Unc6]
MMANKGWGAYIHKNGIFIKTFKHKADARYPDYGCSLEIYTNSKMLELETLGPLFNLKPNQTIQHTENWFLLPLKYSNKIISNTFFDDRFLK